jgi:opacity protein-like surface antigen
MTVARADDLLGLYFGGGYGQARVRAEPGSIIPQSTGALGGFDVTHSAFKAIAGVRPLPFIGAEVSYMDFGKVSSPTGEPVAGLPGVVVSSEQASQKGETAFALLYLPVPIVEAYLKGGLSRITTNFAATYTPAGVGTCVIDSPSCGSRTAVHNSTDTAFAYGAGLQWKLGQWAVRGEYERFSAAGANPSLLSISMTFWLQ